MSDTFWRDSSDEQQLKAERAVAERDAALARLAAAETVIEAARRFADDEVCLDPDCTHKVCVLNRAFDELAVLVADPAAEETR